MRKSADNVSFKAGHTTPGYANYVLAVLFLVYVFNFIDRQILGILLDDIKADLNVSDTAMGLLVGFAFVLFYTFAGIPIARLADRYSRRNIIALGLALWSAMTAASGLAQNFTQLALARVGVGVGEAAGSPPAHSLLADYFPSGRRATALAIYSTGVYVGAMLAFLAGAYVKEAFGWRAAFFVVGIPGLLLAVLVRLTIAEPPRGMSDPAGNSAPASQPGIRETLHYFLHCRALVWLVLAASVQSLSGYSVLVWGPAYLGRVHGMGGVAIGTSLGLIIGVAGSLGGYLGGKWADRLGQADVRWYLRLPALQSLLALPFVVGFVLLNSSTAALLCFIPFYFLGAMYVGPMLSMVQSLAPLQMRATASAILLFVLNMVGLGLGPVLVGAMNDYLFADQGNEAIRYSLLVMGCVGACASVLFWIASRHLPAGLSRLGPHATGQS
jgi:predicted MFS family arabinose efflux permease